MSRCELPTSAAFRGTQNFAIIGIDVIGYVQKLQWLSEHSLLLYILISGVARGGN